MLVIQVAIQRKTRKVRTSVFVRVSFRVYRDYKQNSRELSNSLTFSLLDNFASAVIQQNSQGNLRLADMAGIPQDY
jgi:hypothetical protein